MNFLNLINTVRCSENNPKPEQSDVPTDVIPAIMKEVLQTETPLDRVKRMYSTNEYGFSPEIRQVIQSGVLAASVAAAFGSLSKLNHARNEFFRKNMASTFESQYRAKRNLVDSISLAAIHGGVKSAFKYGSFTTAYLLGTMTVANYRNKITVWEHIAFGGLVSGCTRLNYGVKGFLVAGALGGFLGLIAGGVLQLSMHLTGTTLEELRYYQHEDHYARILRRRRKLEKEKLLNKEQIE